MNRLAQIRALGQSVWYDNIRRGLITSGELERMILEDAVSGVTSNPTIFEKAISGSTDYDRALRELVDGGREDPGDLFFALAVDDIRMTADLLRPIYDETKGVDGYASLEVRPELAHDAKGTVGEALQLFQNLARPNVMIKVPGTDPEGLVAIEELIAQGVNVNVTLLFSVDNYSDVAEAYLRGLERRLEAGEPLDRVASVASFFVSRVDTAVDALLPEGSPLRGKVAVANAKRAYARFREVFSSDRFARLGRAGARVQRPLWASTGTKNALYSDVLYVEELIGPETVNTMPEATLRAFADHGRVECTLDKGLEEAEAALDALAGERVDLDAVTEKLQADGVKSFGDSFDKLLECVARKRDEVLSGHRRYTSSLGDLQEAAEERLRSLAAEDVPRRIWLKDHTVWKSDPTEIANRLGWLTIGEQMAERAGELVDFAAEAAADGFEHVVLMGMGGSSLAPEVIHATFGAADGFPALRVLDTTDPASILALERSVDLDRTLFVVASKSGGTLETLSQFAYFHAKVPHGRQFVAITDPGTSLGSLARENGFRRVFLNPPDIGGRYSALSYFGLVPAALVGAPIHALLDRALEMACSCAACVPAADNPGLWLGVIMGEAARAGRDKLTLVMPAAIGTFGTWVEQLVAESTGKEGKGILPVEGEPVASSEVYGDDRLFVSSDGEVGLEPAVHLTIDEPARLGAEFFRWEFATAVAGAILGINPFDQPNVQEAKDATHRILAAGDVPDPGVDDLEALLTQVRPGDYIAITAYIQRSAENEDALGRVQVRLRDRFRVATTVGFGPRFLHSTGQLHKGGPNTGVFIQVVEDDGVDLEIPGKPYTFGTLKAAQALGDLEALRGHGRRVARVRLETLLEWEG